MAVLISAKLKAATLLEVLVAMVIILIVFVLAMGVYTNVMRNSTTTSQLKANFLVRELIRQSIQDQNWNDLQVNRDSLKLQKTVSPYPDDQSLLVITVTACTQGRQLIKISMLAKKQKDESKH